MSRFSKCRLICGAAKRRQWRTAWKLVILSAQGLARRTCLTCGGKKGFTAWRLCERCQYNNLMKALTED